MNEQLNFFHFVFKATDAALQNWDLVHKIGNNAIGCPGLQVTSLKSAPNSHQDPLVGCPWSFRKHPLCSCPVLHGFWVLWADTGSRSPSPPLGWGDERFGQHVTDVITPWLGSSLGWRPSWSGPISQPRPESSPILPMLYPKEVLKSFFHAWKNYKLCGIITYP